ncbi:hypothetical protein [Euryhalocaulis caribicus]|uniref:hypothetical protein n=1 Tax=Euryhalocaulis caribicus TaxID=1161401 RepID=UPI0003B66027|nr:hypothetical protein [Euryhalocaulis caribicus]
MKPQISAILAMVLLAAAPAWAQEARHGHDAAVEEPDAQDSDSMMAAHKVKMEQMRALMEQARAADHANEKARLIAQHQEIMEERMAMMMAHEDHKVMMKKCHQHMAMMQDMMGQISARYQMMQQNEMDGASLTSR